MTKPDPLKLPPRIKLVAKKIGEAAGLAIDDYAREVITDEPSITDRWIAAVEMALRLSKGVGRGATGIVWEAKTLRSSKGHAAEEKRHGADLLGVAEIHIGSSVVRKGFLGQAKRTEPGEILDNSRWKDLQDQVQVMLKRSPTSFVLAYSKRHGIRFVPAVTVANLQRRDLFEFNSMSLEQFFQLHLGCFIGDPHLNKAHISTLDGMIRLDTGAPDPFSIGHVLEIVVRSEGT